MLYQIAICLLCLSMPASSAARRKEEAESEILRDIMEEFSSADRPVAVGDDGSDVTTVYVSMIVQSIQGLVVRSEELRMQIYLHVTWYDKRLSWDPADYDNVTRIVIPPTVEVWLPRFVLKNTVADEMYAEYYYSLTGIRVRHDGYIIWEPGGVIVTRCDVDITYFPFDTQTCIINYGNWIYSGDQVNLTHHDNALDVMLFLYQLNGEWDIIGSGVHTHAELDAVTGNIYPQVYFELSLRRKWLYYMLNLILPAILLMILQLFAFYLPPDSSDKISFGLTILLSFVVFIIVVSENIPTTSKSVPLIEVFLVVCLVTIIVQVILSIFSLRVQSIVTSYPPDWLKKLCCKPPHRPDEREVAEHGYTKSDSGSYLAGPVTPSQDIMGKKNEVDPFQQRMLSTLEDIRGLLGEMRQSADSGSEMEQMREAWTNIIQAVDRFCFWFFAAFIAILFFAILFVSPIADSKATLHD